MKKYYFLIIVTLILGLVLTGCLLSNVGQVPTTEQSGINYLTKGTETNPEPFPLYAGQDMLVGEVLVWDDGEELCVRYELSEDALDEGWLLYETHLEVSTSLPGIPQKNGNPPPGQFRYGDDELGGVEETEPYCIDFEDIIGFEEGDNLCDTNIVIAAHAVVRKDVVSCNEIGDVYGIESSTGKVWGVNMATQATAEIFTIGALAISNIGPNGLAYDGANGRFYYCEYYSPDGIADLYFWDGEEHLAGTLATGEGSAGIANADFDGGKYYFINGKTDDLFEVTFDADGYIATVTKLNDIAGNAHGWTFDGDIAVKDGVVYGWGKCSIHGKYEYFTYDINLNIFSLIKTDLPSSQQLAFGLDGKLYGHSFYDGSFVEINTGTGDVTELFNAGVKFTDCSSGAICEPIIEIETAWGAEDEGTEPFPGKNWATYFNYTIECPPCMTPDGELTVTGTGWIADYAWCPCKYKYDLTDEGAPVALKGTVDISGAALANTNDWSKYYAKFIISDSDGDTVAVVFNNDWLGKWYEMDAQQWDRIRMENNMGLPQPQQYYATQGGTLGYDMDGVWVGPGNGATVYPSDQNYFFQLIADHAAETFTLQVLGMGSSAPDSPPDAWPKQLMFDEAKWLEIGNINVGSDFNFTEVSICAELWASTQAGTGDTSTITWEDMEVGSPEIW